MAKVAEESGSVRSGSLVDWRDLRFGLIVGVVAAASKLLNHAFPEWGIGRTTTDVLASVLTVGYILARARREPERLEVWGLTTPLTLRALAPAAGLLAAAIAALGVAGWNAAGSLAFEPRYIVEMIEYIPAAYPQQFFMCSVGLVMLSTLSVFRGHWRLPLAVGLVFSLAHFWTPARLPGTFIPIQMLITLPAGFLAAWYFLRFRSILPLTGIHAILYPLLHNWIERNL
ncbi:MAG: CPBP family intramembrane metalloprotease [Candidatus Hydrogenedentes bacterium]|nr:CPBP family intramembrane metalloprotease [Candidatus Hydrogenedentota bacterium]